VLPSPTGGLILEKPKDAADALRMLRLLSGQMHEVLTGVCVRSASQCWTAVESTKVFFAPVSEADLQAYVDSGEPFDKAGAYGIQGRAAQFIPRIEGCYFNVVGLPLHTVRRLLNEALGGGSLAESSSARQ
jgi:septum formation protein